MTNSDTGTNTATEMVALEALAQKAHACLARDDAKQALNIGRELEKRRYSAGFEIQGLALNALGRRDEAIAVLQNGTRAVPHVWLLWQLLGNYLSDSDRYEESFAAYRKGLACEVHDARSLNFNLATAASRSGDPKTALKHLGAVMETGQRLEGWHQQIVLLARVLLLVVYNDMERFDDTQAAFLSSFSDPGLRQDHPEEFSRAAVQHAYALWRSGDIEAARTTVNDAIAANKFNETAHWLDREIRLAQGGGMASTRFSLTLGGLWSAAPATGVPPAQRSGTFCTRYNVVADDADEAFAIARAFEPEPARETLKVVNVQKQTGKPAPKGVYHTSRYFDSAAAQGKRAASA